MIIRCHVAVGQGKICTANSGAYNATHNIPLFSVVSSVEHSVSDTGIGEGRVS